MKNLFVLASLSFCLSTSAQDTFSIVALDSITGEVGSAGASCVDLSFFPGLEDHFLGELFPGVGAINTQAWYIEANQANARNRMNLGDSPQEVIDWLVENDVQNNPSLRQYGIVAMIDGSPESAAHTGSDTDDYKNHVLGLGYAIQGNILLGQEILDNMEGNFLAADGDLSCKLMAALQGANVVGADTRCATNGTSSLFAFLKVAQPDDSFGDPSLVYSVSTSDGDGVEPIDALQTIFDEEVSCTASSVNDMGIKEIKVFPNPTTGHFQVELPSELKTGVWEVHSMDGTLVEQGVFYTKDPSGAIDLRGLAAGSYMLRILSDGQVFSQRFLID